MLAYRVIVEYGEVGAMVPDEIPYGCVVSK